MNPGVEKYEMGSQMDEREAGEEGERVQGCMQVGMQQWACRRRCRSATLLPPHQWDVSSRPIITRSRGQRKVVQVKMQGGGGGGVKEGTVERSVVRGMALCQSIKRERES